MVSETLIEESIKFLPPEAVYLLAWLALFGVVVKILEFFWKIITSLVPKLKKLSLDLIVSFFKNNSLKKAAEAAGIEVLVNEAVLNLQEELPIGWIRKAKIRWDASDKPINLQSIDLIVKVQPVRGQDQNFCKALHTLLRSAMFPQIKELVPINIQESSSLQISRRVILEGYSYLQKTFEEEVLENSIKGDISILDFIDQYKTLDEKGYFTSIFLRELSEIVRRSRFTSLRSSIDSEIADLSRHIKNFMDQVAKSNLKDDETNTYWSRRGGATSFGIILVGVPDRVRKEGAKPYVNRAKKYADEGIERIYYFGRTDQEDFTKQVVDLVAGNPRFILEETFRPSRDYHGLPTGFGALFTVRSGGR